MELGVLGAEGELPGLAEDLGEGVENPALVVETKADKLGGVDEAGSASSVIPGARRSVTEGLGSCA